MSGVEPLAWRELVGRRVQERRTELFPSRRRAADGSGLSEVVWRQIETGKRQLTPDVIVGPHPEVRTKALICKRLGWTDDSIDRLLAGQDPVEVTGTVTVSDRYADPTLAALAADPDLSDDDIETVIALVKRLKGR